MIVVWLGEALSDSYGGTQVRGICDHAPDGGGELQNKCR